MHFVQLLLFPSLRFPTRLSIVLNENVFLYPQNEYLTQTEFSVQSSSVYEPTVLLTSSPLFSLISETVFLIAQYIYSDLNFSVLNCPRFLNLNSSLF